MICNYRKGIRNWPANIRCALLKYYVLYAAHIYHMMYDMEKKIAQLKYSLFKKNRSAEHERLRKLAGIK